MEKQNFNRKMEEEVKSFAPRKPSLLLQSCCGPCSTSTLECLMQYFDVSVLFYNPNIQPREEYDLRLLNQKKVLDALDVKMIDCEYDEESFNKAAAGYENEPEGGKRCRVCFSLRLDMAASEAKKRGFEYFCTTLTVSPHKNAELINTIGSSAAEKYDVKWLPSDFKKKNGYLRSIKMSEELQLYRQNYCGCLFSKWDDKEESK